MLSHASIISAARFSWATWHVHNIAATQFNCSFNWRPQIWSDLQRRRALRCTHPIASGIWRSCIYIDKTAHVNAVSRLLWAWGRRRNWLCMTKFTFLAVHSLSAIRQTVTMKVPVCDNRLMVLAVWISLRRIRAIRSVSCNCTAWSSLSLSFSLSCCLYHSLSAVYATEKWKTYVTAFRFYCS